MSHARFVSTAVVSAAFALTTVVVPAEAGVAVLGAAKDNTLYEDPLGGLSNGAGDHFFVGRTNQFENSIRRGLIQFDLLSQIPEGATATSVELRLHMSLTIVGNQPVSLHRALADWGEAGSHAFGQEGAGGPAEPGDATWLHRFFDTIFWTTPGGDFASTASATGLVGGFGFYTWGSTPGMVADVQMWLDNPAANFGWVLVGNESIQPTSKRFDTRENADTSVRPQLTVEFTPPANLIDVTETFGTITSGGIDELRFADGQVLRHQSQFGFTVQEANVAELQVAAETGGVSPQKLHLFFKSRLNNPGGTATARLRNWSTNQFVTIGTFPIGSTEITHTFADIDATNHVRATDSRIELRYKQAVIATFAVSGFIAIHDVVRIRQEE